MKIAYNIFELMTSLEHLFQCWDQFRQGKRKKKDVQYFERHLEDNIFQLHHDLITFQYQHEPYHHFYVTDPKQRHISKATVRDRLVHHMVYEVLTEIFDKKFIFHSLSSRLGKGTHVGVAQLHQMIRKVSANGIRPCFALKMDIKRFFDSIDHQILKTLLRQKIQDERALHIIDAIIDSFRVNNGSLGEVGIPLGNVTSQLFANVYLHELDDFIKKTLRERFYLRYCDDFIILSNNEHHLYALIATIGDFLSSQLKLELHPRKVIIRKLSQGIDFVGYVLFSHHILLRARTKQRMKKRLNEAYGSYLFGTINAAGMDQKLQSYLGLLSHANQHTLSQALKNAYWVRKENGELDCDTDLIPQ
ncbi:MAG: group II intron reverse transcriptase domain-containing protein [Verrucomicrobia bacterium]|nr:group II intron reverse transcriptase domain-containing protein [Verrucomicrobiota bacterium]